MVDEKSTGNGIKKQVFSTRRRRMSSVAPTLVVNFSSSYYFLLNFFLSGSFKGPGHPTSPFSLSLSDRHRQTFLPEWEHVNTKCRQVGVCLALGDQSEDLGFVFQNQNVSEKKKKKTLKNNCAWKDEEETEHCSQHQHTGIFNVYLDYKFIITQEKEMQLKEEGCFL